MFAYVERFPANKSSMMLVVRRRNVEKKSNLLDGTDQYDAQEITESLMHTSARARSL